MAVLNILLGSLLPYVEVLAARACIRRRVHDVAIICLVLGAGNRPASAQQDRIFTVHCTPTGTYLDGLRLDSASQEQIDALFGKPLRRTRKRVPALEGYKRYTYKMISSRPRVEFWSDKYLKRWSVWMKGSGGVCFDGDTIRIGYPLKAQPAGMTIVPVGTSDGEEHKGEYYRALCMQRVHLRWRLPPGQELDSAILESISITP